MKITIRVKDADRAALAVFARDILERNPRPELMAPDQNTLILDGPATGFSAIEPRLVQDFILARVALSIIEDIYTQANISDNPVMEQWSQAQRGAMNQALAMATDQSSYELLLQARMDDIIADDMIDERCIEYARKLKVQLRLDSNKPSLCHGHETMPPEVIQAAVSMKPVIDHAASLAAQQDQAQARGISPAAIQLDLS